MSHQSLPLAIVGAEFSGTMTALQVLRAMPDVPVLLCERSSRFARGTAYATENSVHLLNVRATNMSAYPDEPDHFVRWLAAEVAQAPVAEIVRHIRDSAAGTFVSRDLYGRYLSGLLRDDLRSTDGALRLRVVPDEVVDLEPAEEGYVLTLAGGRRHRVAGAILAIGNLHADVPAPGRYFEDPWSERLSEEF